MYPVSLGYAAATSRISNLLASGHETEALVTAVFTAEKTLRRTLRQIVVSAGFISRIADRIMSGLRGLDSVKNGWDIYDPKHRKLSDLLQASDWHAIKVAAEMRNKLVHGERVYSVDACRLAATDALRALDNIKTVLDVEYGYSGWTTAKSRRASTLHSDPKIRV
jgi:transaldolase